MEIIKIVRRERNLLEILMIIWEDSVRHTHDFLRESDIKALRPLVYQNLESIPELWAIKAEDSCYKGFMGIDGIKLEMLFVASSERGQGFGSKLLRYAVSGLGVMESTLMNKIRRPIVFIRNKVLKNIRGLSWMDKATRFLFCISGIYLRKMVKNIKKAGRS